MADELIELTVAEAAERIRSGELSADEYFDAYRGGGRGRLPERLPLDR